MLVRLFLVSLFFVGLFAGGGASLSAQTDHEAILDWAPENHFPLSSVAMGTGFADLQPLKPLLQSARLVTLGEATHGVHEFITLRNRLFEFLVTELGFTAIAVEAGFTEAWIVDEYVLGGPGDARVAENAFHWRAPELWEENQDLIDWMRDYNSRPSIDRKIRFYGFDLTGAREEKLEGPRRAVDSALAYLAEVDSALADGARRNLEAYLRRFNESDYQTLQTAERNTLTVLLADVVTTLEREEPTFAAMTGPSEYQVAHQQAVVAQRTDAYFRALASNDGRFGREANDIRDQTMARTAEWIVAREGDQGRVLFFAHNWHVKRTPMWPEAYPEDYPDRPATSMGQYLHLRFGRDMVVVGTGFGDGRGSIYGDYERADPESIDGLLGSVGPPILAIGLDPRTIPEKARIELEAHRMVRDNDRYGGVDLSAAFDLLVYIDSVTPIRIAPTRR